MGRLLGASRDALLPIAGRCISSPREGALPVTLIMQPDHLGDILLSQPAVTLLRESFPNDQLIALVGPWSAEVTRLAWPVDEVIEIDYPGFTRTAASSRWQPYRLLRSERDRLTALHAQRAIVLRPDAWWSAWLGRLIAPVVIGSDDQRVAPFATSVASIDADAHASVRAYQVAAQAAYDESRTISWSDRPLIVSLPESDGVVEELLRTHGIIGSFAVIHPGSGAPVKEWTEHRWRFVAGSLRNEGIAVVVTGSQGEREMAERLVAGLDGTVSIAGKTDVRLLTAVMERASIAIGCDSGPMHLAVATGTSSVHLFGPSDPSRYGPWGDPQRHRVLHAGWSCPRCGDLSARRPRGCGCMLAIHPEQVVAVTTELLHACQS